MTLAESYLPEWRLYLLKKLALDANRLSARSLTTREFLYVTDQEGRDAMMESLNQTMRYIESIPNRVYAGEKIQETADSIAFSKGYTPPEFKPLEVLNALMEWSDEPDAPLRLLKIQISKQYFAIQEKKRIASISSGTWKKENAESLPMTPIEIGTLKSILILSPHLADRIEFQVEIDPAKINKKVEAYLDDFKEQKLIPPKGKRYLAVEEQKAKFLIAVDVLEKRFGKANVSTNFTEIIQIVGREKWREESCRFYETLFLLEQEGVIKIVDLRGLEVVFSVIQNTTSEIITAEPFNIEKEFAKVKRVKNLDAHRIAQEKWLNVKFILGEIGKILPPLKSRLPQSLSLKIDGFSDEQKNLLPLIMEYLLDVGGVELPSQPKPIVVVTSEPLRKLLNAEFAVIGNQDAIEDYISQVYELCELIEEDAVAKFGNKLQKSAPKKTEVLIAPIFPETLPSGTDWPNFIFQFRNNETLTVKVRGITKDLDYEEMGFKDKRKKEKYPPYDQQWQLFLALAKGNGELDADSGLARDGFEKSKEALTEILKKYFSVAYDPFYPVNSMRDGKKKGSYKLRATVMWYSEEADGGVAEDAFTQDIRESYGEETPQIGE